MNTASKVKRFGDLANATGRAHGFRGEYVIDAWESEGGSSAEVPSGLDLTLAVSGAPGSNNAGGLANRSKEWFAFNMPQLDEAQAGAHIEEEDQILRCLGAAVMMRWNTLPTKLQRELFDNASSVRELLPAGALKEQIARFMHTYG